MQHFDQIKEMSKNKFKKLVKTKVKQAAFNFLMNLKGSHSKLNNLKYKELKMQMMEVKSNSIFHLELCWIS